MFFAVIYCIDIYRNVSLQVMKILKYKKNWKQSHNDNFVRTIGFFFKDDPFTEK
jgi:hypothetical protein